MHPRAEEFVAQARERHDFDPDVHEFDEGTKTAAAAAEAIGCDVAQIASSIAVSTDDGLLVVVTSGSNRVDLERVAELNGAATVDMADPDEVKETLGWSIGGVPPFCHAVEVPVYLDETLLSYDEVWAAAGTPEAVFPIDPDELRDIASAQPARVAE
jgi:prolyl-tRNA editing enzyme YbaK/EbsC (Cys-tRNA(Pro) deacylase)